MKGIEKKQLSGVTRVILKIGWLLFSLLVLWVFLDEILPHRLSYSEFEKYMREHRKEQQELIHSYRDPSNRSLELILADRTAQEINAFKNKRLVSSNAAAYYGYEPLVRTIAEGIVEEFRIVMQNLERTEATKRMRKFHPPQQRGNLTP